MFNVESVPRTNLEVLMAGSLGELIGQIINPQPTGLHNVSPITPMSADAPLPELIGRVMAAPAGPAADAVPGVVAEVIDQKPQSLPRRPAVDS
jgi:hypothetical protein